MQQYYIGHVHTHHSHDSLSSPHDLVERAMILGARVLMITDHESLLGSLEARAYARKKNYSLHIPIAAEVRTEIGDLIVADVPEDFRLVTDHIKLAQTCKAVGGYTILPHPYQQHKLDDIEWDLVDAIETINGRCGARTNERALELARKLQKPEFFGVDAHFPWHLDKIRAGFRGDFRSFDHQVFFTGHYRPIWTRASSMIKAGKTRQWKRLAQLILGTPKARRAWARRPIIETKRPAPAKRAAEPDNKPMKSPGLATPGFVSKAGR